MAAVRRRPLAADCNSLYARLRPPPSANSDRWDYFNVFDGEIAAPPCARLR